MFVKQIDMKKAFELAARGNDVKVLVPTGPGTGWESMEPDTLQNMLADCLFFRQEPAMENPELDLALRNSPPNSDGTDPGSPGGAKEPAARCVGSSSKREETEWID